MAQKITMSKQSNLTIAEARLLQKPDVNPCTFSCFKTWVFENYLLATGNRISTALDVRICDINFDSGTITLYIVPNIDGIIYFFSALE